MNGWMDGWVFKENLTEYLNTERDTLGIPGKGNDISKGKKMEIGKLYELYSRCARKSP